MDREGRWATRLALSVAAIAVVGCQGNQLGFQEADGLNPCGSRNPTCRSLTVRAPFPLADDAVAADNVANAVVNRDDDGNLQLDAGRPGLHFAWIVNAEDWGRGTVSKVNTKKRREEARYATVTCYSNALGGRGACDGTVGCCSRDDYARFQARTRNVLEPGHQAVQVTGNSPSRVLMDFNGDAFVANRAFGGQSSVTKIAHRPNDCVERNGTPKLQTSSDVNDDGVIDTDCNRNGIPDDVADVKAKPCVNKGAQEYYGLDDECVLFTTNTNVAQKIGRPVTLAPPMERPVTPSDVWAGTYVDGKFFRVDGLDGLIGSEVQTPPGAYGAVTDENGIVWVSSLYPNGASPLSFFDSRQPQAAGVAREPAVVPGRAAGYGVSLDDSQNVWVAGTDGNAYRYTPDRGGPFAWLGTGKWTVVKDPGAAAGATGGGRGMACDKRGPKDQFCWMAIGDGWIGRLDNSAIPLPVGADKVVDGSKMPAVRVAGLNTRGVGIDTDQNVWGISYGGSVATRVEVDHKGVIKTPDLSPGLTGMGCPAGGSKGDYCELAVAGVASKPSPYTYSDLTGFGLRQFTPPKGTFLITLQAPCERETRWAKAEWVADVPDKAAVAVRGRAGATRAPADGWNAFGPRAMASPVLLDSEFQTKPFVEIEVALGTEERGVSPTVRELTVWYECAEGRVQ